MSHKSFRQQKVCQLYDMPVTGMPPVIDSDLGWTLGMVFRSYVKTADEVFFNVPGGARGYLVLTAAVNEDPMPIGALAQRLGIDKTVMTYVVDALEDATFVERRPCPGRDRRTKQVAGTHLGLEVWEKTQARLRRGEDHVLAALAPDERETFRALLRRLAVEAQAHDPAHDACQVVEELA
jgi:DNA-binding MarR family transcriptional regulator